MSEKECRVSIDFEELRKKVADGAISDEVLCKDVVPMLEALLESSEADGTIIVNEAEFQRLKEVVAPRGEKFAGTFFDELEAASRYNKGFRRFKKALGEFLALADGHARPQDHLHHVAFPLFRGLKQINNKKECREFYEAWLSPADEILQKHSDEQALAVLREWVGCVSDECPLLKTYAAEKVDPRLI